MRLLWTVANWKRTGPVEPSLDLAAAMVARGHDVAVAVGRAPRGVEDHAAAAAARRGLRVVLPDVRLSKHAFFLRDRGDVRRIRAWIAAERPDAVVATLANDHRLVAQAVRGEPPVVRLWFSDGTPPGARETRTLRTARAVVVFGAAPAATLSGLVTSPGKIVTTDPPLDVAALRALAPTREAARARWAPDPRTFLVGIVARLQRHRRFDLLWEALARVRADVPGLRCLVVGRGTWQEEVARGPVAARGLADVVTFAGYLRGADYASALAALDAQVLLVPGSDPTCRALREGMALGVAPVATRRGLLPSIVEDGATGLLVDETPDALAAALARLARDPALRARLGAGAARRADRFAADRVAVDLDRALAGAGGSPG